MLEVDHRGKGGGGGGAFGSYLYSLYIFFLLRVTFFSSSLKLGKNSVVPPPMGSEYIFKFS